MGHRTVMIGRHFLKTAVALLAVWTSTSGFVGRSVSAGSQHHLDQYFDETRVTTLFAFDDVSIPFTRNLRLVMNSPVKHPANPVVRRGGPGAVDSWAVQFYGSVIRETNGRFRMWYVAVSRSERDDRSLPDSFPWRVAYAESEDGINWTKPALGLVEVNGSSENNLVRVEPHFGVLNLKVLAEPGDPDPDQRYRMATHVWFRKNGRRLGTLATFISPDGLNWKQNTGAVPIDAEMPEAAVSIPPLHFEPVGGLYKWDGLYHLSGQNAIVAARPYHGRVARTMVSADFARWTQSSAIQFVRDAQHRLLGPGMSRIGEQTHEGISVWNRGNLLLGISGLWHGTREWDDLTIDLGFVISNDGIRFREPAHEHVFLKRGADGEWDQGGLLQGQGFENVGEQTLIYYGAWDPRSWQKSPPRGGVGIATLPRDRFAALVVDKTTEGSGDYQMKETVSSLTTRSIDRPGGMPVRFYLNASGLSDQARLKIELLNHQLEPLPMYAGENSAIVQRSGFQVPVEWNGQKDVTELPDRFRLRVTCLGENKQDLRFHAVYVQAD